MSTNQWQPLRAGKTSPDEAFLRWSAPTVARDGPPVVVVILPGSGYQLVSVDHEGTNVATWLESIGFESMVLQYRVDPHRHPAPLEDLVLALDLLYEQATADGAESPAVVLFGFSAGAHLAGLAVPALIDAGRPPAALVLAYPVVKMTGPHAHEGSRIGLLGPDVGDDAAEQLSIDALVTAGWPPTFLMHTVVDDLVPTENCVALWTALRGAGVPAELHLYDGGWHGMGIAPPDDHIARWPALAASWLDRILRQGAEHASG